MSDRSLRAILCADWSKSLNRREVYLADVESRHVRRLEGRWTAQAVIAAAREAANGGTALATFDAPIGVPESYWEQVQQRPELSGGAATFADWLPRLLTAPRYFENAGSPPKWDIGRPFFAVLPGTGGLKKWIDALNRSGVKPLREVDTLTRAKTAFAASGIPGVVGSSARELWKELGELDPGKQAIWPFDGSLDQLLKKNRVVVAEIYPRAAYALALSPAAASERAPMQIAKTSCTVRRAALEDLQSASWLQRDGVHLSGIDAALDSDDAFDSLLTAAGLLRCVIEGVRLDEGEPIDSTAEGGILGIGGLNFEEKETAYKSAGAGSRRSSGSRTRLEPRGGGRPGVRLRTYRCPIPRCTKVFTGSRSGWDAHVASVKRHATWQPGLGDPVLRKARFRAEFPQFFDVIVSVREELPRKAWRKGSKARLSRGKEPARRRPGTTTTRETQARRRIRRWLTGWAKLWDIKLVGEVTITFTPRMTRSAGRAIPARRELRFSTRVLHADTPLQKEIACHEFAHLVLAQRPGSRPKPHGPQWQALMRQAGFPPRTGVPLAPGHAGQTTKKKARKAHWLHTCHVCGFQKLARARVPAWRCPSCRTAGLEGRLSAERIAHAGQSP